MAGQHVGRGHARRALKPRGWRLGAVWSGHAAGFDLAGWGDQVVVYDRLSAQTHLLSGTASLLLASFFGSPSEHIRGWPTPGPDLGGVTANLLDLQALAALRLIEPEPV